MLSAVKGDALARQHANALEQAIWGRRLGAADPRGTAEGPLGATCAREKARTGVGYAAQRLTVLWTLGDEKTLRVSSDDDLTDWGKKRASRAGPWSTPEPKPKPLPEPSAAPGGTSSVC